MMKKYYIKPPQGNRKSWAIICYTEIQKKREYLPFTDERVNAVNFQCSTGAISEATTRLLLKDIIRELKAGASGQKTAQAKGELSAENERLFARFWEHKYAERILADEKSAIGDFKRALRMLGTVSIITGSSKDITKALKTSAKDVAQHRRAVSRLGEILQYLKRDITLSLPQEGYRTIKYITLADVQKLAAAAPSEEIKLLTLTLFGTGARLSEAMAITPRDVKYGIVSIDKQLTKGKIKVPKRGKKGRVPIISLMEEAVESWAKVKDKEAFREHIYLFLTSASRRLWPNDPVKHISARALRHSYAIHLLDSGIPLAATAKSLRNGDAVCQKYYTGYEHTEASIDWVKKKI